MCIFIKKCGSKNQFSTVIIQSSVKISNNEKTKNGKQDKCNKTMSPEFNM